MNIRTLNTTLAAALLISSIFAIPFCLAAASDTLLIRTAKLPKTTYVGNMPLTARDPFNWPPVQVKRFAAQERMTNDDPFVGLKLSGIIWNTKLPLAIINNRLLKIGDTINDTHVVAIDRNKVTLTKSGLTHRLEMEEKIINLDGGGEQG